MGIAGRRRVFCCDKGVCVCVCVWLVQTTRRGKDRMLRSSYLQPSVLCPVPCNVFISIRQSEYRLTGELGCFFHWLKHIKFPHRHQSINQVVAVLGIQINSDLHERYVQSWLIMPIYYIIWLGLCNLLILPVNTWGLHQLSAFYLLANGVFSQVRTFYFWCKQSWHVFSSAIGRRCFATECQD